MLRLAAHELRAHIGVLAGYTDMLDDPAVRDHPGRRAKAMAAMRTQLDSLRQMADHLVHSALPSTGADALAYEPVILDISTAAVEALAICNDLAGQRGITLVCDSLQLGDPLVRGDRFHLVTAMRNLLENACRYGPEGGTVRLSLARRDGEVEVLVHDQGEGLRRVGDSAFSPFTRGSGAVDAAPAGLGLGLSLVAQVAELHGGLAVWGEDEDGAVIGFRFPAPAPTAA
jgi:signal transduction histidine kinase